MRGINLARRGLLIATPAILATGLSIPDASSDNGRGAMSLGDMGVKALEKLPWEAEVIRINLGKKRPMSISAFFLMDRNLLVVSAAGRLYCLDRGNFEVRWVNTLRHPLAKPPVESSTHFCFLMKDHQGAHWIQTISKRSGSIGARFPVRLPYSASSGIAANSAMIFVPSLGSPGNNRTLETVNTVSAKRGWGYRTTGMLMAPPATDPAGDLVILAGDDGVVTALSGRATAPNSENWIRDLGGIIRGAPAVTPAHVLVGNSDGILYNLNLFSGKTNWLIGLDEPLRTAPVIFGAVKEIEKSTGVEGAAPVKIRRYVGTVFVRNVKGLHAVDLVSGKKIFTDASGGRALCEHGKYLLTCDGRRRVTIRDANNDYEVSGTINLSMFDLIPTNTANGEIYACTSDGTLVGAIPK